MHLHIAHLYPAQMNIYGDRGNIIVLRQRSLWRGIDVTVDAIHPGATVDWSRYDLCFFGGGQDSGQALIADDFVVRHGTELRAALADGVVMLAICGGYQLLGNYFKTHAGQTLPGIGALDVHTVGGTKRFIGNIAVTVDVPIAQAPSSPDRATTATTKPKVPRCTTHSAVTCTVRSSPRTRSLQIFC